MKIVKIWPYINLQTNDHPTFIRKIFISWVGMAAYLFLSLTHETIATNLDFFNCITVFTESFDKKAYMTYLCYISYNRHFCAIYSCAISWWLENSQKLKYDTLGITILNYTTCSILYSCDHEIRRFFWTGNAQCASS